MSITVMKQALAALEIYGAPVPNVHDTITALRTAIEQAEKAEPVAIDPLPRACNLAGVDYQTYLKIKAYMPVTPTAPVQEPFDTHSLPGKSLDTHSRTPAAQRPWIGLTQEQRNEIVFNAADEESATYQTEDKLRELNGGQA